MDYTPNQIMRMTQLGLKDRLLGSSSIWLCATCSTCTARCPRNLDLARVMDTLRVIAHREGIKARQPEIQIFHQTFLDALCSEGRVSELKMIGQYKIRSRKFMQDVPMGIKMFTKGKLSLKSEKIQGVEEVRKIFKKSGGAR
jgi:heterodisulfide reductase subunit C